MVFQLVQATDDEIIVWHMEHGHIFRFNMAPDRRDLVFGWLRDIPEASERASALQDSAYHYAVDQMRLRRLLPEG